jgi:hypothetical protein
MLGKHDNHKDLLLQLLRDLPSICSPGSGTSKNSPLPGFEDMMKIPEIIGKIIGV